MRRVRYSVAMSLDGYIAGPNGEADWIVMDPEIGAGFPAYYQQFDTFFIGRRTFEAMGGAKKGKKKGGGGGFPGFKVFVFSTTLRPADHPDVTIVSGDIRETVAALKEAPGKDIWLFGGGQLFRSLLDLGLVDTVEVGVIPVLLGGGLPLLPTPAARASLELTGHRVYQATGTLKLDYAVKRAHRAALKTGSSIRRRPGAPPV
jgi:dihydrofolate reductase